MKRILKNWLVGLLLLTVVVMVSGCRTFSFYAQAIKGQYQILAHEQPVQTLLTDPLTPAPLKARLELLGRLLAFAKSNLKLPVDKQYRKYVDLHRPYVVWNVEAAPEFSLEPKTWWYPLVGSLEYRGYFSERGATNYARALRKKGYDVSVGGVTAYSTLGWFKDPVLNTFLFDPEPDLAETLFHELGHQRVFAVGDTAFNEAFATSVGQEGARRWLQSAGNLAEREEFRAHLGRTTQFVGLIMRTRARLESLYGDQEIEEGKAKATAKNRAVPSERLRTQKQAILEDLKTEYARLKATWDGATDYEGWFVQPLNNAQLNSVAAYYDLVGGFEQLLASNGGDLEKFYDAVERLSKKPKKDRHQYLKALGQEKKAAPAIR
jgi:predicted aminopeptidase